MSYHSSYKLFQVDRNNTIDKIRSFARLADGWHFGEGRPASQASVLSAIKVCQSYILAGYEATNAFFGSAGDISVTAYYKEHYVDTIIRVDGKFDLVHEVRDEEILDLSGIEPLDLISALREVNKKIWPGSELYSQAITTPERARSTVLRSRTLPMAQVFQLSARLASKKVDVQYVSILSGITPKELPELPRYFGISQIARYLPEVP